MSIKKLRFDAEAKRTKPRVSNRVLIVADLARKETCGSAACKMHVLRQAFIVQPQCRHLCSVHWHNTSSSEDKYAVYTLICYAYDVC